MRLTTGDPAIDDALGRIATSAGALRGREGELLEHERASLERVTGGYVPTLVQAYLYIPEDRHDAEMSIGGTPREALLRSLECMAALLVLAERRLHGVSATTLAVGRAVLEEQVKEVSARSDTPVVVLEPKEPSSPWPRWIALGVAGFVAFLVVATGAVVAVRAAVAALQPDPEGGGAGVVLVALVLALALAALRKDGERR